MDKTRIPPGHSTNYETLIDAFKNESVCLMRCYDKVDKEFKTILCVMNRNIDTEEIDMLPFAMLFEDNPFERLEPPQPEVKTVQP